MATLGPRGTTELAMLSGWDATELTKFRLADDTPYSTVVARMNAAIGALNAELASDPFWSGLVYFTDQPDLEYRDGTANGMELHTEYGRPDPARAATTGHMLPLQAWDRRLAWTWDYLRKARMPQIEADIADAIKDVRDRWRLQILTRVLKRTDDSGAAKGLGTAGYSPGFATTAGSTNVDFVPPAFAGTTFTNTHEHYVAIAGGAFTAAVFTDAKDELKEHGHTAPFDFLIGPSDRATVTALTGFVGVRSGLIAYGSTADLAADANAVPTPGVDLIGIMSDDFRVWEVRGVPQYYGFAYKSYGPRSMRNPLAVRVTKGATTPRVLVFNDPNAGSPLNPLQNLMLFLEFGVGVNDRTAGTPRYVNNSTWADGTAT